MNKLFKKNNDIEGSDPIILYQAKIHWASYIIPAAYAIVGSLGILPLFILRGTFQIAALLLVILCFNGILKLLRKRKIKIYVIPGYLSISSGIFSQQVVDISLKKMEGMYLHQNWLGKIFNYGTLVVSTGGVTQAYSIKSPVKLREELIIQSSL